MPDSKTIVGVNSKSPNTLITEDITTNKAVSIGKLKGVIYTLLYDKVTETVFAGDEWGHIKQYRRGDSNYGFSLVKDYGYTGIDILYSCAQVGEFAFFAGQENSIIAINIQERRLCRDKIQSPFRRTFSLEVCSTVDQQVYLSLGGYNLCFYYTVSDLLDVTKIHQIHSTETNQNAVKPNEKLSIQKRKDYEIKNNDFEIIQSELDLRRDEKINKGTCKKKICKKVLKQSPIQRIENKNKIVIYQITCERRKSTKDSN